MLPRRKTLLGWAFLFIFVFVLFLPNRNADVYRHTELSFLQQAPEGGKGRPFFDVIAMVPSVAAWKDRRDFLRKQFARNQNLTSARALLIFVLSEDESRQHVIRREALLYSDFLLTDCPDIDIGEPEEGSSTTCKVLQGIQRLHQRYSFNYLARVGDDAYFRFDRFLQKVATALPVGPWYIGRFLWDSSINEAPIYGELRMRHYPSYASGMGYVLSYHVARYIAEASRILEFRTGFPEDTIVALWILGTTTKRHDVLEFHTPPSERFLGRACDEESLLVHYMTAELWKAIDKAGVPHCGAAVISAGTDTSPGVSNKYQRQPAEYQIIIK